MNKRTLGVAAVFLVGCAVGGASSQLVVLKASAQQAATLTKWQVFCEPEIDPEELTARGNQLGAQGWEIVAASGHEVWCFKRPKM
jgi:hypothetical protein